MNVLVRLEVFGRQNSVRFDRFENIYNNSYYLVFHTLRKVRTRNRIYRFDVYNPRTYPSYSVKPIHIPLVFQRITVGAVRLG